MRIERSHFDIEFRRQIIIDVIDHESNLLVYFENKIDIDGFLEPNKMQCNANTISILQISTHLGFNEFLTTSVRPTSNHFPLLVLT